LTELIRFHEKVRKHFLLQNLPKYQKRRPGCPSFFKWIWRKKLTPDNKLFSAKQLQENRQWTFRIFYVGLLLGPCISLENTLTKYCNVFCYTIITFDMKNFRTKGSFQCLEMLLFICMILQSNVCFGGLPLV